MKTKYDTVEFMTFGPEWDCYNNDGENIGRVYYGGFSSRWYYAGRGTGQSAEQLLDIAHFLKQLNDEKKGETP